MIDIHRKIGRFSISRQIVLDNPELVLVIMSKVIVVRAEVLFESDNIDYVALSLCFCDQANGSRAPEYRVIVHASDEGVTDVSFELVQ